jgi:hypothetical protein
LLFDGGLLLVMIEFSEQEPLKAERPIDAPTTAREPNPL